MAQIKVLYKGQLQQTLDLIPGQDYVIGRDAECDIQLKAKSGISRQHAKIYDHNGEWIVELLSRFGRIMSDGTVVEATSLDENTTFVILDYEFVFIPTEEVEEEQEGQEEEQNSKDLVPQGQAPAPPVNKSMVLKGQNTLAQDNFNPEGNLESTDPGVSDVESFLRITNKETGRDEILKLEGNVWVAGRDQSTEIYLDNTHVSRRHFELTKTSEGYYITDLGSSNGTEVNGQVIPSHEPQKLNSGDKIHVMSLRIVFEIHDANFNNKMQVVQQPFPNQQMMQPYHPQNLVQQAPPAVMPMPYMDDTFARPRGRGPQKKSWKDNKVRLALFALVPILLIGLLTDKKKPEEGKQTSASEDQKTFEKLTPEKKQAVKDTFNLAKNHYMQRKYELCIAEIQKLHSIVPFYEDSKSLFNLCQQGSEDRQKMADALRKEQERERIEKQIVYISNQCKQKMTQMTPAQIQECLGPAIELDPEHPSIVEILAYLEQKERNAQQKAAAKAQKAARKAAGRVQYGKAKSLKNNGRLTLAIAQYKKFLNGGYPELGGLKSKAKRELASVVKKRDEKVNTKIASCKALIEKKTYKLAIQSCEEALKEQKGNKTAAELKEQALSELRRDMKALYEDSVLEESIGKVDLAKEKWKKIMELDIPEDEYFKKAKRKLKKYGIGI